MNTYTTQTGRVINTSNLSVRGVGLLKLADDAYAASHLALRTALSVLETVEETVPYRDAERASLAMLRHAERLAITAG